jgi:hypothetical protein
MRIISITAALLLSVALRAQSGTDSEPPDRLVQDTSLAASGDEIRVTAPSLGFHATRGTLVSIRDDSVRFRVPGPGSATIPVAIAMVSSISINHGNLPPHRNALPGAAVGLLAGALAGYTRDKILSSPDGSCLNVCTESGEPVGGGFVGAVAGGLVGAGIGWLIKTGSYQKYDQSEINGVLLVPVWDSAQRAVGLVVAMRF